MRRGLLAGSLALFSLALVLLAWPLIKRRTEPNLPPPRVFVAGQEISLGPQGDGQALEAVRRYALGPVAVLVPRGDKAEKRLFSRAALGAEIDRARLGALLNQVRDPESPMRRSARPGAPLALPIPLSLRRESGLAVLYKLKDEVDRAPLDARFDLETKRLLPEQAGLWIDVF